MPKRTDLMIIGLMIIVMITLVSPNVWAENNNEYDNERINERIIVLDFLALDENGNYIDTLGLQQADLVNLSRIMSQGIAARLVQYGEFDVLDSVSLREQIGTLGFTYETSAYERAQVLLESNLADQVITGSITLLQNTAVLGVQRFQMIDDQPTLVGSAMGTSARVSDTPSLVDTLVTSLFPSDVQVIERSIEQVFVVPSQIRMNLGGSKQITVYALDSMGRPVTNPEFLYFSSDESKVEVSEHGVVKGLQPGTSTITVRAISRTARSGSPATMNVTVVPPVLGVRVGTLVTNRAGIEGRPIRLGIRLTPTVDQRGTQQKTVTPTQTAADITNPLSLVSSFFSSLLTNGLITIDLDFDPTKELLVAFSGVQRSASGYIGTGVGYLSPLDDLSSEKGFVFRFTLGTQYRPSDRFTLPVEAVMDAIFPTASTFKPSFRIGVNVGFDLFP